MCRLVCIAVVVLVLVLVVVIALVIARNRDTVAQFALRRGGAAAAAAAAAAATSLDRRQLQEVHHDHSGIETALHRYALSLGKLPTETTGGARSATQWRSHESWESLSKDKAAYAQYSKDRADVLNSLDLDWTDVMRDVAPKLGDDREYIGLIDAVPAGGSGAARKWKLAVTTIEASPVVKGTTNDGITFASVPAELVEKVARKPAMFIFHTHPDDPKGSPLPSSTDVSTAISMAYAGMYAANVMISRYGAFLYAPSLQVFKDIRDSTDPDLAMRHFRHDAVAALESIRSWKEWTLGDYQRLFDMHKLLYVVYPTSTYTAHSYRLKFRSYQDAPSDEDILTYLRREIEEHRKKSKTVARKKLPT